MLVVNGAKDTQVPLEDVVLLLQHGSPKEAWVNLEDRHMGRIRTLPDTVIFSSVTLPWVVRKLSADGPAQHAPMALSGKPIPASESVP